MNKETQAEENYKENIFISRVFVIVCQYQQKHFRTKLMNQIKSF